MTFGTLLVITLALGVGAFCKGATGMGLPMVALPVLAAAFGVPHAIAILALPVIATNAWQAWHYRVERDRLPFLRGMILPGIAGIAGGTVVLKMVPAAGLSLALGLLLLVYIVLRLTQPSFAMPQRAVLPVARAAGLAAGTLQGATGMSGPVLIAFLHALKLSREAYIFAVSTLFLLLSVAQIGALAVAGLFTWMTLLEGMLALMLVALFVPLGVRLGRHLSADAFDRVILVFLAVMALRLLHHSLAA